MSNTKKELLLKEFDELCKAIREGHALFKSVGDPIKFGEFQEDEIKKWLPDALTQLEQSKDREWKEKMEAAIKHEKDHGIRLKTYPIPPITK